MVASTIAWNSGRKAGATQRAHRPHGVDLAAPGDEVVLQVVERSSTTTTARSGNGRCCGSSVPDGRAATTVARLGGGNRLGDGLLPSTRKRRRSRLSKPCRAQPTMLKPGPRREHPSYRPASTPAGPGPCPQQTSSSRARRPRYGAASTARTPPDRRAAHPSGVRRQILDSWGVLLEGVMQRPLRPRDLSSHYARRHGLSGDSRRTAPGTVEAETARSDRSPASRPGADASRDGAAR